MLANLLKPRAARVESFIVRERPAVPLAPAATAPEARASALLADYAGLAKSIGFAHPHIDADLRIEEFKAFLRKKDWGIFSLKAVIEWMDKKAAAREAGRK